MHLFIVATNIAVLPSPKLAWKVIESRIQKIVVCEGTPTATLLLICRKRSASNCAADVRGHAPLVANDKS